MLSKILEIVSMDAYFTLLPIIGLLLFIAITFLFSFWDKISDWNGNLTFLRSHFAKTSVVPLLPFTLLVITILEFVAGIFALLGIYFLFSDHYFIAILSCILSLIVLFIFLIGQRIAKDFDGAMKITVYIIPVVFCLYLLTSI
ncbi:DoxX family protein [Joostella sp.]|uniref:DoxX family protein n=1 Tax=Joostella sp. TaxID=2231138 RepID=UPI003A8E6970